MNKVFIACSIDGFIADQQGGIDWLHSVPNPDGDDMGYSDFISEIDALVMGRNTFETVLDMDIDWPYQKPVFVLSNRLREVPNELAEKVELIKGDLHDVVKDLNARNYDHLYIDGGSTIQGFLSADLIDEMIITTIPILLGGGTPLFAEQSQQLEFKCIASKIYLGSAVQNHFTRIKAK